MGEWISVKDRLPEESGEYLTVDMDMPPEPYVYVLRYSPRHKLFNTVDAMGEEEARGLAQYVTHWMPLPGLPGGPRGGWMAGTRVDRTVDGYPDPTAGKAYANIRREEKAQESATLDRVAGFMKVARAAAELAGFEIIGRIALRDRETGREYR